VAGPGTQDGQLPGTVYIGLSLGSGSWAVPLQLTGDRSSIRVQTVLLAIEAVRELIARDDAE
jgi:nicotinamide-nucleotide amidase